ncbi:MAG: hypothetical protein M1820_010759 [Bogoriella megaspora]|nr:MAG: hypothetical protein M1820_010759 [Bogoriella megaspora]
MWQPIADEIDWDMIYETPKYVQGEDLRVMKAWRKFLHVSFVESVLIHFKRRSWVDFHDDWRVMVEELGITHPGLDKLPTTRNLEKLAQIGPNASDKQWQLILP